MAEPSKDVFSRHHAQLLSAIEDDPSLTRAQVRVGRRLCQLVKWEKRFAWPKQNTLEKTLNMSRRTVIRATQALVARGHFRIWRYGRNNRYVPRWVGLLDDAVSRGVWRVTEPLGAERGRPDQPTLSLVSETPETGDTNVTYPGGGGENPAKGDTNVTCSGRKGDTNVTCIIDHHNSSSPPLEAVDSVQGAPSAPPDESGGANGTAGQGDQSGRQRELPLVSSVEGGRPDPRAAPENPHAAENAAHARLDKGLFDTFGGEDYGNVIDWLPPEVLGRAVEAELANHGMGVSLIVREWLARGGRKVPERPPALSVGDGTAQPLKRAEGAG